MRIIAAVPFLLLSTVPSIANSCFWLHGTLYCDAGCWVTDRWWQGSTQWMRYACIPSFLLDPGFLVAAIVFAVIFVAGITSSASTNTHEADIEQIERDIASTNEVKKTMEDAMRAADAHIAAMLAKHREGDRHE